MLDPISQHFRLTSQKDTNRARFGVRYCGHVLD
jgi:hypothetical protein